MSILEQYASWTSTTSSISSSTYPLQQLQQWNLYSLGIKFNGWQYIDMPKPKAERGREMKTLYDVYLVYGGDRNKPVVEKVQVIASDMEEAKLKSKLQSKIQDDWDMDFITFCVQPLIAVAVKERPAEVKQV